MAYLVVCEGRNADNVGGVAYREVCATKEKAMSAIITDLGFEIHSRTWDTIYSGDFDTGLATNDGEVYVNWWMMDVGEPGWAVLKAVVDGDVRVERMGSFKTYQEGVARVRELYEQEVAHPSFWDDWDPEYCECFEDAAECTVETRDMVVNFMLVNTAKEFIGRGFEC